ncbi:MAG: hypothetical protein ABEI77_07050 [Halorientalis sp.]
MSVRTFLTDPQSFFAVQREAPNRLAVLLLVCVAGLVPLLAQLSLVSAVVLESKGRCCRT